jgi:hypothetical protein
MNYSEAVALIQRHRRFWRSHESDDGIACRGERAYRTGSAFMAITAVAEAAIAASSKKPVGNLIAVGFLVSAAILYWQSRRFTQALRLLRASRH